MLWAIVKRRLAALERSDDRTALQRLVLQVWDEIALETVNSLVGSFRRRLKMVLDMNGESISQLLSSCIEKPKPQMVIAHDWVPDRVRIFIAGTKDRCRHICTVKGNKFSHKKLPPPLLRRKGPAHGNIFRIFHGCVTDARILRFLHP